MGKFCNHLSIFVKCVQKKNDKNLFKISRGCKMHAPFIITKYDLAYPGTKKINERSDFIIKNF